jgi:hypothetical protein
MRERFLFSLYSRFTTRCMRWPQCDNGLTDTAVTLLLWTHTHIHTYHGLTQASSNKHLKFLLIRIPNLLHLEFLVLRPCGRVAMLLQQLETEDHHAQRFFKNWYITQSRNSPRVWKLKVHSRA